MDALLKKVFIRYFAWTNRFSPSDNEVSRARTAIGVTASFMGIGFALLLGATLFFNGEKLAGAASFMLALVISAVLALYLRGNVSFMTLGYGTFVALIIANSVSTFLVGGLSKAGALPIWVLLAPMLSPILISHRQTIYWALAFVVCVIANLFLPDMFGQTSSLPIQVERFLFMFNILGVSAIVLVVIQFFVVQRDQYQERSDHLLLNILPKEIADILRNENRVVADAFDGASILFADVVNFTPMSATMTPVELVNLLNEVFSYFDTLTEKHQLEKIKTIGDCYMVASGIPRARADHSQAVTNMALDILEYVKGRDFNGRKLAFRIGINSGPVVAGVIGQKKFAYDLWGDAVNTASRMESHGADNAIQITRSTYELIKDDFICEAQTPINVKGKGEMEVWHVTGRK